MKDKEICICAAIKITKNVIIRGHRHGDCYRIIRDLGFIPPTHPNSQGFITSKNRFVTRTQGRKLQDKAGIKSVDPEGYRGNTLFSEDLY